jgi:hypothetical protein
MKRILYSVCIGTLALALTAWGEERNVRTNVKAKARASSTASVQTAAPTKHPAVSNAGRVRAQRSVSTAPFRQRTHKVTPQTTSNAVVRESNLRSDRMRTSRERNLASNNEVRAGNNATINRDRNVTINRDRNVTINRDRSARVGFADAVRLHRHEFHNRDWWRSHFDTIVFVNGGWWFWDAGWWFPAYGYAPGVYYPYDGPIYGYNGLTPDRVVVDVQLQLQRDGYYAGPIDGVLGPMTRRAITAFQADHGLAITSTIDEPTLATLGLS